MSENRKSASFKTALTGIIIQVIAVIFGFIVQKIFIQTLGIEYSGVIGTFGNILSILTLSDIGVSVAISYHLYGALANNDRDKISALITFYHKACKVFVAIVICGGLIMLPFAEVFAGKNSIPDSLYLIFFFHVLTASLQYALNYRRVILNSDQRGYVVNTVVIVCTTILYIAKIFILKFTGSYYLYAIFTIVEKLTENIIIGHIAKKRYPYMDKNLPLDKTVRFDIRKKMYAAVYHNTASYIVNFTDNVIIAQIFGAIQVGLYVNYSMILGAIFNLLNQILNSVVASLGNLLASEGAQKLYRITKNLFLFNFWIYSVISLAAYFCLPSFIALWIGSEYILPEIVVIAIILNFFIRGLRSTASNVLSVAGIMYENRFVPVCEAIVNLTTSIILAKWIGLAGVFIGTILSNLVLHLYSYPKYAFKLVLNRSPFEYILIFAKYLTLFILTWIGLAFLMQFLQFNNPLLEFIIRGMVSVLLPSFIYMLIFFRTEEFQYFFALATKIPNQIKAKTKLLFKH